MAIAFLIEGYEPNYKRVRRFAEITAAKALACANDAILFDVIESYSIKHLVVLLNKSPKDQWPLFALKCMADFAGEGATQDIIDKIIKPAFEQLVIDEKIEELPSWLTELASPTDFKEAQVQKHFEGDLNGFLDFSNKLAKTLLELSDELSAANLSTFLGENPQIDYIYALLGISHIDFATRLDCLELLEEATNFRKLKIRINEREVVLEIHAGIHGEINYLKSLVRSCKTADLVIPEACFEPIIQKLLTAPAEELPAAVATAKGKKDALLFGSELLEEAGTTTDRMINIETAAYRFDCWMNQAIGHTEPCSSELIDWLYLDFGADLIPTYEIFCTLTKKLISMGYDLSPYPNKDEFDKAFMRFKERKESHRAYACDG